MSWMFVLAMAPSAVPAVAAPSPAVAAQLTRLDGHHFTVALDGRTFTIDNVAGEGPPHIGSIQRRGEHLFLIEEDGRAWQLTGPLARPRIAGPGYRVWVLGETRDDSTLRPRRLGVLAPPPR